MSQPEVMVALLLITAVIAWITTDDIGPPWA